MAKRPAKPVAEPPATYRVFVSHATPDKWVATVLCEKIDGAGALSFRDDRDIEGGDDIPDRLRAEIKRADELLVLLTPISVNRPWVLLEIGAAWEADKRIVPICYHVKADKIPAILAKRKAYGLNDFDRYLAELSARLSGGSG
jgi:hypothetical protein